MATLLLVQTPNSTYAVRQHLPSRDVVDPPLFTITGDVTVIGRDGFAAARHLAASDFYNLACVYPLAAAKLPPSDADRAAARSVATLRQAIAQGSRGFAYMLKGSDLDSLRRRDDH